MHVALVFSIVLTLLYGCDAYLDDIENDYKDFQNKNSSHQQNSDKECSQKPVDCAEIYENGFQKSDIYEVYPKSRILGASIKVYCDMETDGGGWTVIQRRGDFKRPVDYFFKTWNLYKQGFGSLKRDFWLGNDNIHVLSNQKRYSARFDLGAEGETAFAIYDSFWIDNEDLKYKLHISDYSGNAGNSMGYHNGMMFSTKDQKNSNWRNDCAQLWKGGWWYNECYNCNLNGLYLNGRYNEDVMNGTIWYLWKGYRVSLSTVEIKIRPQDY